MNCKNMNLKNFRIYYIIYDFFTATFNISISYASLSVSLAIVGLIIGLLVNGFLSDRKGRLAFIHLSILFTAIILLILPLFNSFSVIIGLRFLHGIAFSGLLS